MDKRGRLFGKINIIDALVVLLFIGLAVAVTYRYTAVGMVREADSRVRYTLMVDGVRDLQVPYYQVGLRAWDRRQQQYIGDIVDVRHRPQMIALELPDGSLVMAERPSIVVIYVDIEADARVTASAVLIEGAYELKVGSRVMLNTKYIDVEATIIAAEIIN